MNAVVRFIASPAGRLIRIVAGIGLIAWGQAAVGGSDGYIIATIGVLPLLTGIFDICLIAPLLGAPLKGAKVRSVDG
jgi:hypothetical protein